MGSRVLCVIATVAWLTALGVSAFGQAPAVDNVAVIFNDDEIIVENVFAEERAIQNFRVALPPRVEAVPVEVEQASDEKLPAEAQKILKIYDATADEIRRKAEQSIRDRRDALIQKLQALQDEYTRAAKLDEAVAIRDTLRLLRVAHLKPRPNPGSLMNYSTKIGKTFYFDVVGSRRGSVWGSDEYTCDSTLATATVHAGVLKEGQRGLVKVTIVESPDQFAGSVSHGVRTMDFGPFPASYTVERPLPTDVDANDGANEPAADAPKIVVPGF